MGAGRGSEGGRGRGGSYEAKGKEEKARQACGFFLLGWNSLPFWFCQPLFLPPLARRACSSSRRHPTALAPAVAAAEVAGNATLLMRRRGIYVFVCRRLVKEIATRGCSIPHEPSVGVPLCLVLRATLTNAVIVRHRGLLCSDKKWPWNWPQKVAETRGCRFSYILSQNGGRSDTARARIIKRFDCSALRTGHA